MSNVIEVEAKYFCEDEIALNKKIQEQNMKKLEPLHEIDEYFTDIDSEFIRNRTCLRIRRNNENMELTFKGKCSALNKEVYAQKENNINIASSEYDEIVGFLLALGYYSYVEVEKERSMYTKNIDGLVYNVMIDKITGVGNFIEFEVLCDDENKSLEYLKECLERFIFNFNDLKMEVADLPYRDFMSKYLYKKIINNKNKDTLLLDLDGTLINSEKEFFNSFRDVIYNKYGYQISLNEYVENELNKDANLINELKNKGIINKEDLETVIMADVYKLYENNFINVINQKITLVNFDLLRKLKDIGFTICIVSTSKRKYIDILLDKLNGSDIFDFIVSREDVTSLKPDSEAYELAIKTLNVDKDKCIVVEDSKRGIESAKKLGLDVLQVDEFSINKQNVEDVINVKSFSKLALILLNNSNLDKKDF